MKWGSPNLLQPTPHMGWGHWAWLMEYAVKAKRCLEIGAGGSTLLWRLACPMAEHLTVEFEAQWANPINERVGNVVLWHPTLQLDGLWDVILLDGGDRVEWLNRLPDLLAPGGVLFLHDAERQYPIPHALRQVDYRVDATWIENPNAAMALLMKP